jgi:hypothetical protein
MAVDRLPASRGDVVHRRDLPALHGFDGSVYVRMKHRIRRVYGVAPITNGWVDVLGVRELWREFGKEIP